MPSGKTIYYYQTREEDGRRTTAKTTPSAAKAHCRQLAAKGKLIPKDNGTPAVTTFGELARDFWTWNKSAYIHTRLRFSDPRRPALGQRYAHDMARVVEVHLLPAFRRRRLDLITPQDVESFALRLRDGGLSGKRVNNIVTCMRIMLAEAHRAGILPWDPKWKDVIHALGSARRERGRLTLDEMRRLFLEENIATAWKGHTLYRAVNLVAAATGCRQGELLATRDADVHPDYLHVEHSWTIGYGLGPTKTRQARDVPLPSRVYQAIEPFLGSGGFVFSMTRGETPCTGNRVTGALYAALDSIGVKDRAERDITFHSWRHWLNSTLRARAVPDPLVRRVTGHATELMTEHYTGFIREDFAPVLAVQEEVFA
jgi:integrase